MILTQRQSKILQACLKSDEFIRISTLAELVQASTRTIQRECKSLEDIVHQFNLKLVIKNREGLQIVGSEENKRTLESELIEQVVDYINKEERRNLLIFELLRTNQVEKLVHFANIFRVSEATISHDLDVIETWFDQFNLQIVRKPGLGVEVQGDESNYRQALTSIVHENIVDNPNYQSVNPYEGDDVLEQLFKTDEGIMKLLDQEILERVIDVLSSNMHELKLDKYTQSSYMGLILHITIAISRIKMNEALDKDDEIKKLITDKKSQSKAEKIVKLLEEEFEIEIPEVELSYISLHLQCGKEIRNSESIESREINDYIEAMIESLDEPYRSVVKRDSIFRSGLTSHLKPTLVRLENNLPIYNPLLEDLKINFKEVYRQACQAADVLSKKLNICINEDEIGYLAMHIGASFERGQGNVHQQEKITIGIVCASGIGVSALLEARLKKSLDVNVKLKTMSMEDIEYSSCDLLVTTLDLSVKGRQLYIVNPLLTKSDIESIKEKIKEIRLRQPQKKKTHVQINVSENLVYMKEVSDFVLKLCGRMTDLISSDEVEKDELIEMVISKLKVNKPKEVFEAIKKREQIGQTIYPDFGFGLIHAETIEVDEPYYCIAYPQSTEFQSISLKAIQFVIFIIIPKSTSAHQRELISKMNQTILEESVKDLICRRNKEEIKIYFENLLWQQIQKKMNQEEDDD